MHDVHATLASADEMAADGPLGRFDTQVLSLIVAHRTPALAATARAVTILGEPAACLSAVAAAAAWRLSHDSASGSDCPMLGRVASALAAGVGGRAVLCRALHRPRPPATIWRVVPEGASFPSKHTTYAGLGAGLVAFLAVPGGSARVRTAALAAATVVGASRLVLGVHWPSDVVAAGALVSGLLEWVVHPPSRHRSIPEPTRRHRHCTSMRTKSGTVSDGGASRGPSSRCWGAGPRLAGGGQRSSPTTSHFSTRPGYVPEVTATSSDGEMT